MATTIPSAALVPVTPVFTKTERLALAGFLAGYSGLTRQANELDLRQYAAWCQHSPLRLFAAAPTSRASPATWRTAAAPAPPSPGGCAPGPARAGVLAWLSRWRTPGSWREYQRVPRRRRRVGIPADPTARAGRRCEQTVMSR